MSQLETNNNKDILSQDSHRSSSTDRTENYNANPNNVDIIIKTHPKRRYTTDVIYRVENDKNTVDAQHTIKKQKRPRRFSIAFGPVSDDSEYFSCEIEQKENENGDTIVKTSQDKQEQSCSGVVNS